MRCGASPTPPSHGACIRNPRVVLYKADGCHLCDRAREQLQALSDELGFAFDEIGIDGDPELERRYRELIPIVEIDGERVCTYYVQPEPFRRKLAAAQARVSEGSL